MKNDESPADLMTLAVNRNAATRHLSRFAITLGLLLVVSCGAEDQSPTTIGSETPTTQPPPPTATTTKPTTSSTTPLTQQGCVGFEGPLTLVDLGPRPGMGTIHAGDFSGDGLADLVITRDDNFEDLEISVLLNRGNGAVVDVTTDFLGTPPTAVLVRDAVVVDLNGDGLDDFYLGDHGVDRDPFPGHRNILLLSDGDGGLRDASATLPGGAGFTHSVTAADVDGDGDIDIYVGEIYAPDRVPPRLLINDGAAEFSIADDALPAFLEPLDDLIYTASLLVDVTGDGAPDLILGSAQDTPDSLILVNDGGGRFDLLPDALPPKPHRPDDVALDIIAMDVNRDGHADLIFDYVGVDYTGRYLQLLVNRGDGTFQDETDARMPQAQRAGIWALELIPIDIDRDGDQDIIVRLLGPEPELFTNDGTGNFTLSSALPHLGSYLLATGDENGDGVPDLIFSYSGYGGGREQHFVYRGCG